MNLPPLFPPQFFDSNGDPLAGGKLYTYVSGTTTPQATYTSQAGGSANANPIILDSAGRCDLWLDPDLEYTFVLRTSADVLVDTWDNVAGAANANEVVTSVNSETGAVTLTADDIGYTTGAAAAFMTATDVAGALDLLAEEIDTVGGATVTAASVTVADAGNNFTGTNVETVLAEIDTRIDSVVLPSQTGNSGKFLTTNGTAASWATVTPSGSSAAAFTATIAGGNISTSVAGGPQPYGSRTVSASGGTAPYEYQWVLQVEQSASTTARMYLTTSSTGTSVSISGSADGETLYAQLLCIVTDADGRVTMDRISITGGHAPIP